ncbi:MAG: SDR family oxidoreductase [Candidatus Latescibacteria bacterium]|nr:SDR family oxidoreductase [Candidatus Latescibacterota bacterium]
MSLEGKKALVTGGRRNIGRGIALALAEAGCDVGINDIERDADAEQTLELIRGHNCDADFFQASIADSAQVEAMFAAFTARFGRIDILVNNPFAGGGATFLELTEENWDLTLDVCLKGFFLCSQQAARIMVAQGEGGSIVSTSSVHAQRAWPSDTAYGVAKAGVLRLTESMAVDLGPHNIRCNAVMPGHMQVGHVFGSQAPRVGSAPGNLKSNIPLQRRGTPEDIGRAVAFLCSPAAANITGVSLPVEGGLLATGV